MSSEARDEDEFPSKITKSNHEGHWKILKHEFLRLVRIRDFLSLILSYPMTMPYQHLLRKWVDDAQVLNAKYFEQIDNIGIEEGSKVSPWMHMLSEKPLRYMEGLIPNDILSKIENGQRSAFNETVAILSDELLTSSSTSKGKQVLELTNVHDVIPEAILNLAADLSVDQLIQTLIKCNVHHVRLSTRNDIEKLAVMKKIEVALNVFGNSVLIDDKYSRVLWIDASNYGGNAKVGVQEEIARQLNLVSTKGDQPDQDDILLTRHIEDEMARKKHLVFLLDWDVNGKLDPRKMGFQKKSLAGAVVLITTESSVHGNDELTMAMDLEIRTEDHMLPWELFCRNVGRELVRSSSTIERIVVEIVEGIRGYLPATVLVAKWLKNVKDVSVWEIARDNLRHPELYDMSKFMVNAFENIIWNFLNGMEKLCLASCLYFLGIKDTMLDHVLISSWVNYKLMFSQEEAEHILRHLVDRSILLQLEGMYIQLPEETYDALKSLLKLDPSEEIRQGGLGLTEPPNIGEWLGAKRIELIDNKLSELPLPPACPVLEVLLLQGNADLMEIPPSFFAVMPKLLVLDLSYTSIRSFPGSFFDLQELRELHLKGCKRFVKLQPEIGRLGNVEILDLDGTPIIYLPKQVQKLTKLRKLILSFSTYHENTDYDMKSKQYPVPSGVMSKLTQLQHLSIDVIPDDKYWEENVQIILQDISGLRELRTLSLYIPRVELLKHVLEDPDGEYLDFRIVVGRHMQRIISRAPPIVEAKFKKSYCSLEFVNGVNIPDDINKVLRRTKALFLKRHTTIKHLSEFEMENLEQLKICIVGECNEMQSLINEICSYDEPLPNLEFLCVFYMSNLRSVCRGKVCFNWLKTMALHTCPELTTILTLDFLDSLSNLEELIVEDCAKVSTLISHETFEATERIFLPGLRKVSLLYLPKLVSISSGFRIGPNLESIGFYDCPELQSLSTMELCSQYLKVIKGEKKWWDTLNWDEAKWGKGRPKYLDDIFSPINEEADIMDQFVRDEDESSKSNEKEIWVENLEEILKEQQQHSLPLKKVVSDEDESSRSNKKEIRVENLEEKLEEQQQHSLPHKKQKITMKVKMNCQKCRTKALKVAASTYGVSSVSIEGEDKDKVVVIGTGVDAVKLASSMRKKVGRTDFISVDEVKDKSNDQKTGSLIESVKTMKHELLIQPRSNRGRTIY